MIVRNILQSNQTQPHFGFFSPVFTMRLLLVSLAAAATLLCPLYAHADAASDYNLFVLGNMTAQSSDVEGRVAVGGDANLSHYSVGLKANPADVNLVVKGDLVASQGNTTGETIVGGAATFSEWSTLGLQPPGTAVPVDFDAEMVRLDQLTETLADYVQNGTVSYEDYSNNHGGQITLTGTNAGLNVFNLTDAEASNTNTFQINLEPGSTALINVTGTNDTISNAGMFITGGDASNVLWNFSDAQTLSFQSIGFEGSVLAPNASYAGTGVLFGQLIVNNFGDFAPNQSTQINDVNFRGNLLVSAAPEPSIWALLIAGFGIMGLAIRYRRRDLQLSTGV